MQISVPTIQIEGHAGSAPKYIYIGLEVYIATAISLLIMILIKFNLELIFK